MTKRKMRRYAVLAALIMALALLPVSAFATGDEPPLPEQFDLRCADLDGDGVYRNYVTPVKYQNPFATCWAFGGIAAAETSILSETRTDYAESGRLNAESGSLLDLSEKHLAWFATHPIAAEEDPDQAGEGLQLFNEDSNPNGVYNDGGYAIYISTLFSSGVGPVREEGFPYRGRTGLTVYENLLTEEGMAEYKESTWEAILKDFQEDEGHEPASYEELRAWLNDTWNQYETQDDLLEAMYQDELATMKNKNEYSARDDWTIPTLSEDGSYNRNLFNGYTLRDGNILPVLAQYDEDGEQYLGVSANGMRAVKEELMAGRGVILSFRADQSRPNQNNQSKYMDLNNWAHYTDAVLPSNHIVCIVGWDDTYPKENFVHTPPGDGAWIVKNSWGSELNWQTMEDGSVIGKNAWGIPDADGNHTGYFYLSYYDQSLAKAPETFRFTNDLEGDSFYTSQYDMMPAYSGFNSAYSEAILATANVFTAQADQWLTSVSTRTCEENADVTFRVCLLDDDYENPMDGKCVSVFQVDFARKGYHRVDLETPVALREGQRYAVISTVSYLWLNDKGEARTYYQFSANRGTGRELSQAVHDSLYCTAVVNPGESWLYANDTWQDWVDSVYRMNDVNEGFAVDNFSIKAFGIPMEAVWIEDSLTLSRLPEGVRAIVAAYDASDRLTEAQVFTEAGSWTPGAEPAELKVFYVDNAWRPLCEPTVLAFGD